MLPCERCGRLVADGSTDFGGGLVLRPTCDGIEVQARGSVVQHVSVDEMRGFLLRSYGDGSADLTRALSALRFIREFALQCLSGGESRNAAIESMLALARDGLGEPGEAENVKS